MISLFKKSIHTKGRSWLIATLVIVLTFIFGIGSYSDNLLLKKVDYFFYDQFVQVSGSQKASDRITIIDIDETSLSGVGQWPWPRYRVAQIVKNINALKPKVIGFDIILPESDRTSLKNIKEQFQKDFELELGFTGVPSSLTDNDAYLAYIFKQSPVIGSRFFFFDHFNLKAPCFYNPFDLSDHTGKLQLHSANGILCNTADIENSLQFTGFTNNQYDEDGIIRKTPLLINYKDQIFTHLSFSTFLKLQGIDQATILENRFGVYIKAGHLKIPITLDGYIHMRFSGPARQYKYISAIDILNGTFSPDDISDKIILIGSSAIGLNDVHHTVYDSQFPGVEINAVILDNIMDNHLIIKPVWSKLFIFILCLLTGMIITFLMFQWYGPKTFFLIVVIWICTIFFASICLFYYQNIFISPGQPILLSLFYFSIFSFVRFVQTRQDSFEWYKKLASSQQLTMEAMVSLVETRDPETGQHIKRTQHYAKSITVYLKRKGWFPEILTDEFIEMLFLSVPLHDIGKVGIPDRILLKPCSLTDNEFDMMKMHTTFGRETIERATQNFKGDNYLILGAEIAGSHHERWDGKGYPEGLSGNGIPLSGRIMAIADVYDALISRRCYKEPFSHEQSLKLILEGNNTMFDPTIVEAFITIESEIKTIASRFKDKIEDAPENVKKIFLGSLSK